MPSFLGGLLGLIPLWILLHLWSLTPRQHISRAEWRNVFVAMVLLIGGTTVLMSDNAPVDPESWKYFREAYLWTPVSLFLLFVAADFCTDGLFSKALRAQVRLDEEAEKKKDDQGKDDPS